MPVRILHTQFTYTVSDEELERCARRLANPVSEVPGLVWKIWLVNRDRKIAGGVYLFLDELHLQRFLDGPIVAELARMPGIASLTLRVFESLGDMNRTTRAPFAAALSR